MCGAFIRANPGCAQEQSKHQRFSAIALNSPHGVVHVARKNLRAVSRGGVPSHSCSLSPDQVLARTLERGALFTIHRVTIAAFTAMRSAMKQFLEMAAGVGKTFLSRPARVVGRKAVPDLSRTKCDAVPVVLLN
jgi:hypothetical protein